MKAAVEHLEQTFAFSERRACRLIGLPASTFRYQSKCNDEPLRTQLVELAQERPRFGYRRLHVLLLYDTLLLTNAYQSPSISIRCTISSRSSTALPKRCSSSTLDATDELSPRISNWRKSPNPLTPRFGHFPPP